MVFNPTKQTKVRPSPKAPVWKRPQRGESRRCSGLCESLWMPLPLLARAAASSVTVWCLVSDKGLGERMELPMSLITAVAQCKWHHPVWLSPFLCNSHILVRNHQVLSAERSDQRHQRRPISQTNLSDAAEMNACASRPCRVYLTNILVFPIQLVKHTVQASVV